MLGKTLDGKYRIERLLGTGGMGSVYAAEDLRAGRTVAVKLIHKHLAEGRALVQRFEREARAAGSIDTDHIARCFDTGTDPESGSPYMVLEYLVGEDLQHAIRRLGPLMPEVALRIVAQTCLGVAKAHEAGVVHRDIKPANIFLARAEGTARIVKVLDFGVAKIRRDDGDAGASTSGGLTRTGSLLGSPLYMSPEQARSVKNVDHRSDIWSLGVVLYQAVAGRTPYQDITGLGDLILALCSELPPPVQGHAPWLAPEIAAIVDRALRIAPDERFQTVEEMLEALRPLLPGGHELRDEMLASLDDATHDHVAATYLRSARVTGVASADALAGTAVAAPLTAAPSSASQRPEGVASGPPPPLTASSPPGGTQSTQSAVATTGPGLPEAGGRGVSPPAPRQVPILAMAIACVVAGGSAVYAFTRPTAPAPAAAPPPPPTVIVAPSAAVVAPPPAPLPTDTPSAAPPPMPSETASARHAPSAVVPGPMPSPQGQHARPGPAPSASAPRAAPLDYSSFGGRK